MQVTFALDGVVSTAAVEAIRHPSEGRPTRDLLVLHGNGRLGLYIGSWLACHVTLQPPSASLYGRLTGSSAGGQQQEGVPVAFQPLVTYLAKVALLAAHMLTVKRFLIPAALI